MLPSFATERIGVGAAEVEFGRWGWIFREQPVSDFGIDAHVEPFDAGSASGQLIALQIKTGPSYFEDPVEGGWIYRGTDRHLRYWLRHCLPVILLLHDPESGITYWERVTAQAVEYTEAGWKMLVPADHVLSPESCADFVAVAESAGGAAGDPVGESCALLPPSCAEIIQSAATAEPSGSLRLAAMLAAGREAPRLVAESILSARPSWLARGSGQFEAAVATYAGEHGHPDVAAEAMERAAQYGEHPDVRLLAFAALYAAEAGDAVRAQTLMSQLGVNTDSPILLITAAAVVESLGQFGPAVIPARLEAAGPGELAAEPTCLAFLGVQALRRGEFSAAIRYLQEGCAALPESTSLSLQLAQALLARVVAGQSAVEAEDMRRIEEAARAALEQRRRWSGPSSPALAMLIRRQMLSGAFEAAAFLATPVPEGEALEREAIADDVVILGTQAALDVHDRERALQFAARADSDQARCVVAALLAEPDLSADQQAGLWRSVLAAVPPGEFRFMAWHRLACLGEWPLPGLDELRSSGALDEVVVDVLAARSSAARGELTAALATLRHHAATSPVAAEILVDVLQEAGRFDEALDEAARGFERFGEAILSHKRLNLLVLTDQPDEAAIEAIRLLGRPGTAPELRLQARQRLIGHYAYRGDWPAVEDQSRAALADFPGRADFQWNLIAAVTNRGQLDRAWELLSQFHPAITTTGHAGLWLAHHARNGFTADDVSTALDLMDRWPDDKDFEGQALAAFLGAAGRRGPAGNPVLPELDPQTLERFQAKLAVYTSQNPDGPVRAIPADARDLADLLRAELAPQAERIEYLEHLVREGRVSVATLAAIMRKSYASALLQRACGIILAVTPDPDPYVSELKAADGALDGLVVIHSSALAVATMIPDRWPSLRGVFTEVKLARDAWADFQAAHDDLLRDPGTRFMIGYDLRRQALTSYQLSRDDYDYLTRRLADIDSALHGITVVPTPDLDGFSGYSPADTDPALSPLALAARSALPLWCDDPLIRGLAEQHGIATFGTLALLETLIEADRMPDTLRQDVLTLARGFVTDLMLAPEELHELAAETSYQPGPATTIISRAVFWADPAAALGTFLDLISQVHQHAPTMVVAWVAAASAGLAARQTDQATAARARSLAEAVAQRVQANDDLRSRLVQTAEQTVGARPAVLEDDTQARANRT